MKATAQLRVPAAAASLITSEIRRYGAHVVETGGYLLAAEATDRVSIVAFAGDSGIVRNRLFFQISELALDQLFIFAEQRGCWVPAQFHSHSGGAFLSSTDRQHGLRVEGFISAVVPAFSEPPEDLAKWGWWQFDGVRWRSVRTPSAGDGSVEIAIFDEDGIRGG